MSGAMAQAPSAVVAPTTPARAQDEAAVRALFAELLAAWGRGDGRAYGELFVADAEYIAFDGSHTHGREAIATSHQQLFDTFLKGTRLVGEIVGIRFLAPDVALLHTTGGTVGRGKARTAPEKDSIQTLVAARQGEAWRFVAFHNTRVRPIGPGFAAIITWLFTDLLWKLIRRKHAVRA